MKELRYTLFLLAISFVFAIVLTNCKTVDDGWNQKEIDWITENVR